MHFATLPVMLRRCTRDRARLTFSYVVVLMAALMGGHTHAHAHGSPLESACRALSAATSQRLRCPSALLAWRRAAQAPGGSAKARGMPGPSPLPPARPARPRGRREREQLAAVRGLLTRLLPDHADTFKLRMGLRCHDDHVACFEVAADAGAVSVRGTTGAPS